MKQSQRWLVPTVGTLLLASGAGSLVLEVVWSRSLKLVFGSTTLAVSTILVAYMLGLGLGGIWGGRLAKRVRSGVRVYGMMEMGVGLYALAVPFLLELYPSLHKVLLSGWPFWPAAVVRFLAVLALLLAPTLCMGATLPILVASLIRSSRDFGRHVGLLYGLNTLGAVVGTLGSAFFLFGAVGLRWSNVVGAGMDFVAGAIAFFLIAPRIAGAEPVEARSEQRARAAAESRTARRWNASLLSYGIMGFVALTFEVAWFRLLSMIFGSSIYAFSVMLAAFLLGIAGGSLLIRRWLDAFRNPRVVYALLTCLVGLLSAGSLIVVRILPSFFLGLIERGGITGENLVFSGALVALVALLPGTLALGALFPIACRMNADAAGEAGRAVGDVYFINTIGSALGALMAGFVLIPVFGVRRTLGLAVALALLVTAAHFLLLLRPAGRRQLLGGLASAVIALLFLFSPPGWDRENLVRGLYYQTMLDLDFGVPLQPMEGGLLSQMLYYREGLNTTVSIHRVPGGVTLRLNGKNDASLGDMSTQLLSGHIPMIFGQPAETALVIGFASGVTTGAVTLYGTQRVDVAEIESAVLEASHYFDAVNHRPLENPKVHVIVDDGRSYLAGTDRKYDLIISEPSNPWISGCSNLFTQEYMQIAKASLNPGGHLLQWIQLYDIELDAFTSILAALTAEFPHVYTFSAAADDSDMMILAGLEPLKREDLRRWEDLDQAVRRDLESLGIFRTEDILSLMRLDDEAVHDLARKAPIINTDSSMFVELRTPWSLNENPDEVWNAVEADDRAVARVLEQALGRVSAEQWARLARSYVRRRLNPKIASLLLARAQAAGGSPAILSAQAALEAFSRQADRLRLEALLDAAISGGDLDFETFEQRAELRIERGDLDGALQDLDRCLQLRPEYWPALRARLRVLGSLGRGAEAFAVAERLLNSPMVRLAPRTRAEAAVAAAVVGRFDVAIAEMQRFLEHSPISPQEWQMLARFHQDAGQPKEARRAEAQARKAAYNQTVMAFRFAMSEELSGRHDAARALLENITRRDPGFAPAHRALEELSPPADS
ncbi:MAG: fused MFS/spermidine synthase [Acidobacteriota bacterium]|nr:fused MFS/spermidine synthase [Acidobacteriota bacterium]